MRLTGRFDRTTDRLRLTYHPVQWGLVLILSPWLIGWTVGCVFVVRTAIDERSLISTLFAVPFLATWVFVFGIVLQTVSRREELILDGDGAKFTRQVLRWRKSRMVPLSEILGFGTSTSVTDDETGACEIGIEMRTIGKPIDFASGMAEVERTWLIFELNEQLGVLTKTISDTARPFTETPARIAEIAQRRPVEVMTLSADRLNPPSDCRWSRTDEWNATGFVQCGSWYGSAIYGLLFINAFWNGGVAVFLTLLFDGQANGLDGFGFGRWGSYLFLLPFVGIGMVMLLALIHAVFEPARTTTWRFADDSIRYRWSWFGVGWTHTTPVIRIDRLELRDAGVYPKAQRISLVEFVRYSLALVDPTHADICVIDNLTEGEARWIANVLQRERRNWFH